MAGTSTWLSKATPRHKPAGRGQKERTKVLWPWGIDLPIDAVTSPGYHYHLVEYVLGELT